ncbi:hypothetical protein [Kineosporia sp. NBRC 101731]|uniref:hypothetical protein n=1 Tax=Kineosporia sp. NBRC 101731 TaxID=3032199 RepID=UPI0024A393E6|nr:hypothetical protein [Kineosporia sp. NBRC 101731]GLY26831.1 hypothetical protein Kisp02_01960 [Kineosporia sp. NBRC 101731]
MESKDLRSSYIGGDQINIHGSFAIGKISHGESRNQDLNITTADRNRAAVELEDFISFLEKRKLVDGASVLTAEVEPLIEAQKPSLAHVLKMVSLGAGRQILKIVEHAAAPVLVAMIENGNL